MPLATIMMSGGDPRPFMREKAAGAAHAALDLVEDQEKPMLVAKVAQALETLVGAAGGCRFRPGSGSTMIAPTSGSAAAARSASWSPKGSCRKPGRRGARSPWSVSRTRRQRSRRWSGRGRPPLERQDCGALGRVALGPVLAGHLDGEFRRLGPELQKKTVSAKVCSTSLSASASCWGTV